MDFGNLLKQAQDMQRKLERIEAELTERVVEGTAGGGLVQAFISGDLEIRSIKISPEAADPEDVEALEDLVVAAVRDGLKQAKAIAEESKRAVMGGGLGALRGLL